MYIQERIRITSEGSFGKVGDDLYNHQKCEWLGRTGNGLGFWYEAIHRELAPTGFITHARLSDAARIMDLCAELGGGDPVLSYVGTAEDAKADIADGEAVAEVDIDGVVRWYDEPEGWIGSLRAEDYVPSGDGDCAPKAGAEEGSKDNG
jgi:hypothetical protein